jgi:hypothetical protein
MRRSFPVRGSSAGDGRGFASTVDVSGLGSDSPADAISHRPSGVLRATIRRLPSLRVTESAYGNQPWGS